MNDVESIMAVKRKCRRKNSICGSMKGSDIKENIIDSGVLDGWVR